MNGQRRRSAIVAVALMATMSAGVALAADTGLPPGFIKTGLRSLSTGDATVSNTLARYSLGGTAAVGQALRQSDEAGVATGASYVSTLRGVTPDNSLARAESAADCGGAAHVDLTNSARALTGGASAGRETLANSGFATIRPAYANRGSFTDQNGLLASSRSRGTPGVSLARLAEALAGDSGEQANLVSSSTDFPKLGGGDSSDSNPSSDMGPGANPAIPLSPSDPSYPIPPLGPPHNAMRGSIPANAGFARLADALTGSTSAGQSTLVSGRLATASGTYLAPGQDNGAYGAAVARTRIPERRTPAADVSQMPRVLASDSSDTSSFAASPMNNGNFHRAGISRATTSNVVSSRAHTEAPSIDMVRLAEALTGN